MCQSYHRVNGEWWLVNEGKPELGDWVLGDEVLGNQGLGV
jgi:hypothetical protein